MCQMSPNPKTNQKPTTVPPHISVKNGRMGTFQIGILCTCTVIRHLCHMNKIFVHLRGAAVLGEVSKTMVRLCLWPSILPYVPYCKLAIIRNCIWYVLHTTDFYVKIGNPTVDFLFRIPHKPLAGSLKVLHAPACRGGIRRASQTKIYNLETNEFISNPPFLKTNLAGVISYPTFWQEQLELIQN